MYECETGVCWKYNYTCTAVALSASKRSRVHILVRERAFWNDVNDRAHTHKLTHAANGQALTYATD